MGGTDEWTRAARAAAFLSKAVDAALSEAAVSMPQYRLLAYLDLGDQAASRLAEHLAVSRPSITALVDGLVERGLVERRHSENDRRKVLHQITADGAAHLRRADEAVAAGLQALDAELPANDAMVNGLLRVADTLEARREHQGRTMEAAR